MRQLLTERPVEELVVRRSADEAVAGLEPELHALQPDRVQPFGIRCFHAERQRG
jgi:hypothetical protein